MNAFRSAFILVVAALTTPLIVGEDRRIETKHVPSDELKMLYLSCDRAATGGELNTTGIMYCSVVYEELKWRVFDGSFEKLLAWSRSQPSGGETRPTDFPAAN